jgi:predicted RNA-binding Zn-ribbon protein involved in translation (DUF1610 family)
MVRRDRVTPGHQVLRLRGRAPSAWNDNLVVAMCPQCGSVRLIPLNFATYRREDRYKRQSREAIRPVAKCVSCGERIFARTTIREILPSHWS